jgi:uncharacterized membrane protein YbhN (UPF0104 family)
MDRAMGLTELTLMASVILTVVFLAGLAPPETLRLPGVLLGVMVVLLVAGFAFLFSARMRRALRLGRLYGRLPLSGHLAVARKAVLQYRGNVRRLIEAMGITLVGQTLWIGSMFLVGRSLALATPWTTYFLYVPVIFAIASVPLTPGGLGLVEKFFVVFFTSPAASASEVVALALLIRLMPIFWSVPGAVVAVTGAKVPPARDIEAELGWTQDSPRGRGSP